MDEEQSLLLFLSTNILNICFILYLFFDLYTLWYDSIDRKELIFYALLIVFIYTTWIGTILLTITIQYTDPFSKQFIRLQTTISSIALFFYLLSIFLNYSTLHAANESKQRKFGVMTFSIIMIILNSLTIYFTIN